MPNGSPYDSLHHVAIAVDNVAKAVQWYRQTFRCEIAYQDDTWALLQFANVALALVIPEQHPPHLGFVTPLAHEHGPLKRHRDGTESVYISDPAGNPVELLSPESVAPATARS
jgi:catechol-2,3-dioxygenase